MFLKLCFVWFCSFIVSSLLREEISLKSQNAVFCRNKLVLVSYRNYNFAMLAMLCYNLNHQESAKIGMRKRRVWKDEEGAQSGEQAAPQEVEEDKATIKSFVRNKRTRARVDTREQNWTQNRREEGAELESHSEITNHCESRPVSHFLKRRFIILLFLL